MEITIIIPTTNHRNMLVSRSLEYYRNYNMRVIIVDNSTISSNFSLKKKMYFHLPKKDFIYRLFMASKNRQQNMSRYVKMMTF